MESQARQSGEKETASVNVEGTCDGCGFGQTVTGDVVPYSVHALSILTNWALGNALKISYGSAKDMVDAAHKAHDPNCRRIPEYTWVK